MKKLFTKGIGVVSVIIFFIGAALPARAQYVKTVFDSSVHHWAMAKDGVGNIYVTQSISGTQGEVVKYTSSTGASQVIFTGLYTDDDQGIGGDAPWGLAVNSSGDVYLTTDFSGKNTLNGVANSAPDFCNIIKLQSNNGFAGTSYSASVYQGNNSDYYGALAFDSSDNLYVTEYDGSTYYAIYEYPKGTAANSDGRGTQIYDHLNNNTGDTYPTGMAIDGSSNIYVTNPFAQSGTADGGQVLELTASSGYAYASRVVISSGDYCAALCLDPSGNLYTEQTNGTMENDYQLVEYKNATGSGTVINALDGNIADLVLPYGVAAPSSSEIFANTGDDGSNSGGAVWEFTANATTQASSLTFSGTTGTSTTASWTNGNGADRAVFIKATSSGTPSVTDGAAYTASTTYGSGSTAGTGWYCVYNGAGTSVTITGLTAGVTYTAMAVEYNGTTGYQDYLTTSTTGNPNSFITETSISSITANSTYSNASTITFAVTFGASITGLSTNNFSLTASGVSGASVASVGGSGSSYTVTVNTGTGNGTIGLNLQNSTNLSPGISTTLPFAGGTTTVDKTPPTIMIGSPSVSSIVDGAGSVTYSVTYADANFNTSTLTTSNITLNTTSTASGTVGLSGSGTSYTVTISSITGSGTLGISIAAGTASDKAGNTAPASTSATFNVVTPTISTAGGTVTVPATTSGTAGSSTSFAVSGSNLSGNLTATAPTNVQVSSDNSNWNSTATITESGGTISSAPVYVRLAGTGTVGTIAGNVQLSGGGATTVDQAVSGTLNTPSTTISSLTAVSSTTTNASSIQWTATFAASISGLSTADFMLNTAGITGAAIAAVSEVSGTTWTITVNTGSGNGTIQLEMNSASGVTPSVSNVSFTGDIYTIYKTQPSVSIGAPSFSYANSSTSVSYTVTYTDPYLNNASINLTTSDILSNLTTTGTPSITGVSTTRTGNTVQVTFNASGNGTIAFTVPINTASDNAGNLAAASSLSTAFTEDNIAPTVTIGALSTTLTNTGPVTYDVSYSDANFHTSSLSASNVTLNSTGGASATVSVTLNSSTDYTVTLSGITGNGTLGISIQPGTSSDLAGNTDIGAGPSATFTVDNTPPTVVSFNGQNSNPTNSTYVTYSISFSEAVTGVTGDDFTIVGSGLTASGLSIGQLSPSLYDVTVGNISGTGTLRLDLNSSGTGITDLAGNPLSGGFSSTTYNIDQTPPTVSSITATTPSNANPTNATSVTYTVTFSKPVTGVSNIGFMATTTNTVASTGIAVTPVSSSVYSVTVSGISGDGTLRLDLNNGNTGIFDMVGNPLSGGFTSGDVYTIDNTAPAFTGLLYTSSNTNSAYAKVGDVVTLSFGTSEAVQAPSVTIAGHAITATNTGGNNYSASYTMTSGDTEGRIPYALTVTDLAGNSSNETDVAAGDLITFDMTAPTISIGAPSVASIGTGGAGTVSYTITYADANFNAISLSPSDVTLNSTNTATGTVGVSNSATTSTVTISNITGTGSLGISIGAGTASDLAGNLAPASSASATFTVLSNDATLASLGLSNGTLSPVFASGTTIYNISVGNGLSTMTVTPTTTDPNATITVQGQAVTTGQPSQYLTLFTGVNNIPVVVKSSDGTITQTYTLNIKEAKSQNANLSALKRSSGILIPGFTADGTTYTENVDNGTATMSVIPTAANVNATITVNGTAVASGSPSPTYNLTEGGATVITVVVTAQLGNTKTYTLTVNRSLSSDASLSSLQISAGTLVPTFQPLTLLNSYGAKVSSSITMIQVTPTATNANIQGITVNTATVSSGSPSGLITLNPGSNPITIVVTAQDGTQRTYTVTINRVTNDASLSNLQVNVGTLTPAFEPLTQQDNYGANEANGTSSINVTATTTDPNATVTINTNTVTSGQPTAVATSTGTNPVTITVTAADGSTMRTYNLSINVAAPPSDNTAYQPVSVEKPTNGLTLNNDGITVHQAISPNGDGINDFLQIDNISQYPDNKLSIMNRNGQLIYEASGYDNSSKTFDGHSNKTGQMQLPGTYFYQLDYTVNGITKHQTGFLVLKY